MDLRILMVGDDPCHILPDMQLLRDRGFRVYTVFNHDNIAEVKNEIQPHIVFFDVKSMDDSSISMLNEASGPCSVVRTMNEDSYMAIRYMPESHRKQVTLANNLISAIRNVLNNKANGLKKALVKTPQNIDLHTISA